MTRNNFILSCMVSQIYFQSYPNSFYFLQIAMDPTTKLSKRFAFVDFSSKEAAKLCMEAWNNNCMKRYPNRLTVTMFDSDH